MYAVVRLGGKQHRVQKGERLKVEKIEHDIGAQVDITDVLLIAGEGAAKIGHPLVAGASVTAKVLAHGRGPKIRVFKRRKRKGFHKTIGHRQPFTEVEILGITG